MFIVALIAVIAFCWTNADILKYYWLQASGQISVMRKSVPNDEALKYLTKVQQVNLALVAEIKKFSVDSLGLSPSNSYQKTFLQHGRPLLWVLIASEPYALKAKTYDFPILGTFSYKGFFDSLELEKAKLNLEMQGFDTQINEVSAYSTLGFLSDPILSENLNGSPGAVAELFFHELTHGTLFTGTDLTFNENLADFVADYATPRFLKHKYGAASKELSDYHLRNNYHKAYAAHMHRGVDILQKTYAGFSPKTDAAAKTKIKLKLIRDIIANTDTLLGGKYRGRPKRYDQEHLPNNAYFVGFLTYQALQNQFDVEFRTKFAGDFNAYFTYLKQKYPSISWRSAKQFF